MPWQIAAQAVQAQSPESSLDQLVSDYFSKADPSEQTVTVKRIEQAVKGDLTAVAGAVRRFTPWKSLERQRRTFPLPSEGGGLNLACFVPEGYDPLRAYPVILRMPDAGLPEATYERKSGGPHDSIDRARAILGDSAAGFVFVCPSKPIGGCFAEPLDRDGQFLQMLREMRRQIHCDPDRLYLFGEGRGGHDAGAALISYPQLFAGVILFDDCPALPYPRESASLLLPNIGSLPILAARKIREQGSSASGLLPWEVCDEVVLPMMARRGPNTRLVQYTRSDPGDTWLPREAVKRVLDSKRLPVGTSQVLWFRFPLQTKMSWLQVRKLSHEPWTHDQLSIVPSPTVDAGEYVTSVLKANLAFVSGRIEGRSVTIETQNCEEIELQLPLELLLTPEPLSITVNGRLRRPRVIRPQIEVLLETVNETWDFSTLYAAKLRLSTRYNDQRE